MQNFFKKLLTMLAPVLGAGAIGVCPLCWLGSASLLTYLGLGALIPAWRWLAFGLIAVGAVGFLLDYRAHKNPKPLTLLIIGAILLYVGRYVFASTWGAWWIWGPGAILIVAAIIYNKSLFRKPRTQTQTSLGTKTEQPVPQKISAPKRAPLESHFPNYISQWIILSICHASFLTGRGRLGRRGLGEECRAVRASKPRRLTC